MSLQCLATVHITYCTVHLQCSFGEPFFFFLIVLNSYKFFFRSFVYIYIVILTQQISQYFHNYWVQLSVSYDTYRIMCKTFCIVSVYRKCSWILRYSVRIVWIVSYRKILRIVWYMDKCFKMRFFVKICTFIWI